MTNLAVDLTGFDSDTSHNHYWNQNRHAPEWYLWSNEEAKRAVKEYGITRRCDDVDLIELRIPPRVQNFSGDFLKHLLGPSARKLTPAVLQNKLYVHISGRDELVSNSLHPMAMAIRHYLTDEEYKIAERAKKKADKKPENIVWGEPTGLFVPDINTKLRLVIPWNLTIYLEHRNEKFLRWIHNDPNLNAWFHRNSGDKESPVQIQEGSIIIVDRVYIRQGKGFEDFSSLTFRIQKGSTVVFKGNTFTAKGNHRFWAKLRHVNQIVANVDLNSLPGQEKDGTARKD